LSCSKKADDTSLLCSTLQEGSWKVTSFDYTDRNCTSWYSGYKFTFTVENEVTAIGTNFYAGKWIVRNDPDRLVLLLDFTKIFPIEVLNYDWTVTSYTDQALYLEWNNPYFGGIDYIVFEKI
jgi:hypothetical protein